MSRREAAAMLAISLATLDRLVRRGLLPCFRIGVGDRTVKFDAADLDLYLTSRRTQD